MARKRFAGAFREHAHRSVRAYSAVVGLSAVGLGHGGRGAGAWILEEARLRNRAERAHPPDDAEGGRERPVSHGGIDSISTTCAGLSGFARTDEGAGREVEERAGNHRSGFCERQAGPGGGGFESRVGTKKTNRRKNEKTTYGLHFCGDLAAGVAGRFKGGEQAAERRREPGDSSGEYR